MSGGAKPIRINNEKLYNMRLERNMKEVEKEIRKLTGKKGKERELMFLNQVKDQIIEGIALPKPLSSLGRLSRMDAAAKNPWIAHIKEWVHQANKGVSKEERINFGQVLSDPVLREECKKDYKAKR